MTLVKVSDKDMQHCHFLKLTRDIGGPPSGAPYMENNVHELCNKREGVDLQVVGGGISRRRMENWFLPRVHLGTADRVISNPTLQKPLKPPPPPITTSTTASRLAIPLAVHPHNQRRSSAHMDPTSSSFFSRI